MGKIQRTRELWRTRIVFTSHFGTGVDDYLVDNICWVRLSDMKRGVNDKARPEPCWWMARPFAHFANTGVSSVVVRNENPRPFELAQDTVNNPPLVIYLFQQ